MNDNQLSEDLAAFANELRNQPLAANVFNRDQLMFECGRAAAARPPKRNTSQAVRVRQSLLVACSICIGAMATQWFVPAEVVVVHTPLSSQTVDRNEPTIAAEANPAWQHSEQELAAVRSGQLLCASSRLSALDPFSISPASHSPLNDGPLMRAGMRNQVTDLP